MIAKLRRKIVKMDSFSIPALKDIVYIIPTDTTEMGIEKDNVDNMTIVN